MEPSDLLAAAPDRKRKRSPPEVDRAKTDSSDRAAIGREEKVCMTRPPPTEEEVEEFFAILRRIHNAVERSGKRSHGSTTRTGRLTALRLQGELPSTPVLANGGSPGKLSRLVAGANNGVIDLNSLPEDAAEANGR